VPKRDTSYSKLHEILFIFLHESKEVPYWRKISGYGLTGSDFDKIPDQIGHVKGLGKEYSRKIFLGYRDRLLKRKFITQIKCSDKRSTYYSITPLGICHLQNEPYASDRIGRWEVKQVFKIMETFLNKQTPFKSKILGPEKFDFEHIWNRLNYVEDEHDIRECLDSVFMDLISINDREAVISFPITRTINCKIAEFAFRKDSISLQETLSPLDFPRELPLELTEEEFHYCFAVYVLAILCYYLVKSKIDSYVSISASRKAREEPIKDLQDMLEKIGMYDEEITRLVILFNNYFKEFLDKSLTNIDSLNYTIKQFHNEIPARISS